MGINGAVAPLIPHTAHRCRAVALSPTLVAQEARQSISINMLLTMAMNDLKIKLLELRQPLSYLTLWLLEVA